MWAQSWICVEIQYLDLHVFEIISKIMDLDIQVIDLEVQLMDLGVQIIDLELTQRFGRPNLWFLK